MPCIFDMTSRRNWVIESIWLTYMIIIRRHLRVSKIEDYFKYRYNVLYIWLICNGIGICGLKESDLSKKAAHLLIKGIFPTVIVFWKCTLNVQKSWQQLVKWNGNLIAHLYVFEKSVSYFWNLNEHFLSTHIIGKFTQKILLKSIVTKK